VCLLTEPYASSSAPEHLIPNTIRLDVARNQLAFRIGEYLVARRGFWYCLRHGALRAWWKYL
jgi:hypothetical protein